jgi:hypothetical protein
MKALRSKFGIACTGLLLAISMPITLISSDVSAQEITSSIAGTVLQPDGQPATGVSAEVVDGRDGRRQTSSADDRGIVHFRSISPGGPYTVRLSAPGYEDVLITDLYTDVAGTSSFTVTLENASAGIEEIVVTAAQIQTIVTASGPSSSFSLQTITDMPSTTRQIRDVIRLDPRVSIGATGDGGDQSGAISCLGGSSRTNSFTVDGVRATDAFGLNLSGNLSRFTFPIPFDTVSAAAVEFAPVSVEYGQFSGCNVNVVTKSGENEFHGGAFYLMNDDGLTGTKIDGEKQNLGTFERKNYGAEFSGPIIKDKLFFYGSYEWFETATVNPYGSADDSSFPRNNTTLTTAELNEIKSILTSKYGRDPGEPIRNLPVESERYFARIDWNINDDHRLEGTYASVEESTLIGDDIGSGRGQYTFSDNFHARGSDSETYGVRLYSDWTDRLSTELRYSSQEVIDLQNPFGGGEDVDSEPKPRITICDDCFLPQVIGIGEFAGQEFVSGPGTFRSANKLTTNKDQFKFKADYQWGDHLITAGYEYETLDVYNLFIINATGTVMFDSIAALDAGTAYEIEKGTSYTRDPNDAAAIYTRDINSVFLQDKWDISDRAQLIFGVRYDWYTSDDLPLLNDNYVARYGFTNQVGFDGLDAVQPRIGFNYTLPDSWGDTRMSLGFGVFSGNDPSVWFSNAYQNFGGALGNGQTLTNVGGTAAPLCTPADRQVLNGGTFTGIPDCIIAAGQAQAAATLGTVNATDPNFDLPTVNRYSFGLEHNTDMDSDLLSGWNLRLDIIYSDMKDQVDWVNLGQTAIGTSPDGRTVWATVDGLRENCDATFNGIRQGYSNVTDPCIGGNTDILFTNKPGDGGYTFTTSIQASKAFEWGSAGQTSLTAGYSYNESEVANAGTSFTASGNFSDVVFDDLGAPPVGPSYRNVPHNFVIAATVSNEFWSGYKSSVTALFQRRAGTSLSATYSGDNYNASIGDAGDVARNLVYVPTDENDPLVNFGDDFDTTAFFAWTDKNGFKRGRIVNKGTVDQSWQSDLDIRIQQEIPFFGGAKGKIYLDIENFLNLVSSSGGTKKYYDADPDSAVGIVDGTVDSVANQFNYDSFIEPVKLPDQFDSLYRIQLGVRVDF